MRIRGEQMARRGVMPITTGRSLCVLAITLLIWPTPLLANDLTSPRPADVPNAAAPKAPRRAGSFSLQNLQDWRTARAVAQAIEQTPGLPPGRIIVGSRLQTVTLSGLVASPAAKQRAGRIAEQVRGVRGVRNRLEVRSADGGS